MAAKGRLSPKGQKQFDVVMKTFGQGKLRDRSGKTIKDKTRAVAVAFSEGRAAETRGTAERTFKGRTRMRPKLKG